MRHSVDPALNCPLCPRLVAFRQEWQAKETAWFNAPVPSFGPVNARLLILGLAPGLRGANATGRPFTGDYAGDLLYQTLGRFGLSEGVYKSRSDDGLRLIDARITNAVRCVPPQNKPIGLEINNCRPFLAATIDEMPNLSAVLALGRIAHDTFLRFLGARIAPYSFAHQARHDLNLPDGRPVTLFDSYHCSRYNTNTGRLTEAMFEAVFGDIQAYLNRSGAQSV